MRIALPLSLLAAAALAACGNPPPPNAPAPTASASAPTPPPAPTAAPTAQPTVSAAVPAEPPGMGASTPIGASAMAKDAAKLGVDFKRPLGSLPLSTKKQVMKLFVKSLGFESCEGCHVEGDFKTETRNLKIARKMWDTFVVKMRDQKGEPVFCDSCHNGKEKLLDRASDASLKRFMDAEYKGKLTRADKQDNNCGQCHGYPFVGPIIRETWGIAAK